MYKIILLIIIIILLGVYFYYTKTHNIKEGLPDLSPNYSNPNNPADSNSFLNCGTVQYYWSWFDGYQIQINGINAANNFLSTYENNKQYITNDSQNITSQWTWAYNRLNTKSGTSIQQDYNTSWDDLMLMQYSDSYADPDKNCDRYTLTVGNSLQNIMNNNLEQGIFIALNTPFAVAAGGNQYVDNFLNVYKGWTNTLNSYAQQINNRYHLNNCDTSVSLGGNSAPNSSFDNITSVKNCTPFQKTYANTISKASAYKNGVNNSNIDAIASVDFNTYISSIFPNTNTFNNIQNALSAGVINQFQTAGDSCYMGAQLDINGIQTCFGSDPSNNPQKNANATGAYTNALSAYQNLMNTYIGTTTSNIPVSKLITLQQQLDASFSAAIAPGLYQNVLSNLNSFTNSINSTFDQNCNPTTQLDASGIYKCFGQGVNGDYLTSPLGQLQSSCQKALRAANENQDISDLPTLYNNCSNFFRNNLANTVSDISKNISNLMAYNDQVISNNLYYTEQLNAAKNQTCKQNSPIILPVSNLINNTLTTYNETMIPYLDNLIKELTQMSQSLPNTISIGEVEKGPPGSSPYIAINPVDQTNAQVVSMTVAQGKQGPRGPEGQSGSQGNPGPNGLPGTVGNKGVLMQPIQYQSVF